MTRSNQPLRIFGEMVAVLWNDGKHDAALSLEELWNDLREEHDFSLFCAYPLKCFEQAGFKWPNGKSLPSTYKDHSRGKLFLAYDARRTASCDRISSTAHGATRGGDRGAGGSHFESAEPGQRTRVN
jgi:hypothetical protein